MMISTAIMTAECEECGAEFTVEVGDDPERTLEEQAIEELEGLGWTCSRFGTWCEDCEDKCEDKVD